MLLIFKDQESMKHSKKVLLINIGCAAAMISNVGSIFAEMVLTGFSSVAVAIVSACSNDKKCTIAAKKFWAEAVKYSPILVCAVGGAMACHESGQDQKGALNGMVVGLFRIFREQIFPFTRLNRGYPETNNPDIARDFFTIYGLMIFVSAGVAGALSIHSNLLAGAINELFGLAQALNGINV